MMYVYKAWFLIHWRTHFNYFRLSKFAKCFHPLLFLQHIACTPPPKAGHIGDRSVKDREPGYVKHSVIHTWERAVKMPFACLREDITLQGTMYSGYSIRCEEFCCSRVGEARICLTLHQFYYLKIVRNLKCVCWILSDFLLISILAACTRSEAEIRLCYSKREICIMFSQSPVEWLLSDICLHLMWHTCWQGPIAPLNVAIKEESTVHHWHRVAKNSPSLAVR